MFRPKIYIPSGLSAEERRYIVLHEQTHIKRHDHIIKMVAYLVLCLHWFNPFAWAAFLLMGADQEMSCDERVMKELGRQYQKRLFYVSRPYGNGTAHTKRQSARIRRRWYEREG
jgi:beta-lactamase regulating signal transducer with metallopeptidase domain